MRFPLRPLHALADAAMGSAMLALSYQFAPSPWALGSMAAGVYFLFQIVQFPTRNLTIDESGVRQVAPARGIGRAMVCEFKWDEVKAIRGAMSLDSAGTAWLWGTPTSVQLNDRYVTLYPEAFGAEALKAFLDAAEVRGLIDP